MSRPADAWTHPWAVALARDPYPMATGMSEFISSHILHHAIDKEEHRAHSDPIFAILDQYQDYRRLDQRTVSCPYVVVNAT